MNGADLARRALLKTTPARTRRALMRLRWMVLAPHPDDETLGTGGLLSSLAAAGRPASVVYLTDGSASHPGSPSWPRARLAALRRREARAALRQLCGGRGSTPLFLDWPDGSPLAPGSAAFAASARRLAARLRRDRITALVSTWPDEPHCDHAAAAALAQAATALCHGRVALYWCVVWGWSAPEMAALAATPATPIRNDARARRACRRALARHRSQLGGVIADSPDPFRLPPAMTRIEDQLLYRHPTCQTAAR